MKKEINLLWTGGWDSTYRLLELLLVHKKVVQPYYIISRSRQTWELEIRTMDKIRRAVYKKHPQAEELFLPTIYKERQEIKPNEQISEHYKRLAMNVHLGDQYEYLARYAEEAGINNLELCIDMRTPGFFTTNIKPCLVQETENSFYNYGLREQLPNEDLMLFKYFTFPIHQYTKRDLENLSRKYKFLDIMDLSWFCHYPSNQKPCGVCHPCQVTLEHGMHRRIPLSGHIRNFIWFTIKPPLKKILKPLLQRTVVQAP